MGRTFLVSTSCWSHMTLSSGMSVVASCASTNERVHSSSSNCFAGRVPLLLSEHQLCIELGSGTPRAGLLMAHLIVRMPRLSEQAPLLASSCEGDDGVQMFLSIASRPRSTHRRQFDVVQRSDTCFASTLLPLRAPRQSLHRPSPQAIRAPSSHSTLVG